MRSFDRARISAEAKAAFERGESFEDAVRSQYQPHTPAWRCFQSSYRSHRISSLMATDPAAPLLSSGGSVEETPAPVSHNDSRSL